MAGIETIRVVRPQGHQSLCAAPSPPRHRKLEEFGWIDNDYLVTWDERQPDREDPTAADRQRRRREKLKIERAGKAARDTQFEELAALRY